MPKSVVPTGSTACIKAVLLDFGGVVADEGFVEAMTVLARNLGISPSVLVETAFKTSHEIGFSRGRVREEEYWPVLARKVGKPEHVLNVKEEIFARYRLRPWVFDIVHRMRERGILVCLLSDQSHWLDELDDRLGFFRHFDRVFNSYHMGVTKKDPRVFDLVLERLGTAPSQVLFIDDHLPHVERARCKGLNVIHFGGREDFLAQLERYFPSHIF